MFGPVELEIGKNFDIFTCDPIFSFHAFADVVKHTGLDCNQPGGVELLDKFIL